METCIVAFWDGSLFAELFDNFSLQLSVHDGGKYSKNYGFIIFQLNLESFVGSSA